MFEVDGSGRWEPLTPANPKVAAGVPVSPFHPQGYRLGDLADICVITRLATGAAGATRMDRPEWTAVNPFNGESCITNCPGNAGYGPRGTVARPRSATVVLTRNDGGVIGFDPALQARRG